MSFAIYKGEKSVTDLAARLFGLQGKGQHPAARQAGDLLLKANPQLKNMSQVPVGSVIVVPPEAPSLQPGGSPVPADLLRAFAAERAHQLLDGLDSRLAEIESQAQDATNSILLQAKSKEAKTASASNPTLRANLPTITKSADARLTELKSGQASRSKAIAELRAGLKQFLGNS